MLTYFIAIAAFFQTRVNAECSNESPPQVPKYYLTEKCHRSTLGVVARVNYASLESCQRLGIEKKGLALNFSPPEALEDGVEAPDYSCEVLRCPEFETALSLTNDTRFDYYSLYARPMPHVNATCVPGIGMLTLLKGKLNYSEAVDHCRNQSGYLVDVAGETRTDTFAQLLAGAKVDAAYVGMSSNNGSAYVTVTGDLLDCTTYRAWAPGHPKRKKRKYACVVTTRTRTWRTVHCGSKLPALCELTPNGPYVPGSIKAARTRNDTMLEQNSTSISKTYKINQHEP